MLINYCPTTPKPNKLKFIFILNTPKHFQENQKKMRAKQVEKQNNSLCGWENLSKKKKQFSFKISTNQVKSPWFVFILTKIRKTIKYLIVNRDCSGFL